MTLKKQAAEGNGLTTNSVLAATDVYYLEERSEVCFQKSITCLWTLMDTLHVHGNVQSLDVHVFLFLAFIICCQLLANDDLIAALLSVWWDV